MIDRHLPEWHVRSLHSLEVAAPPEVAYRAARSLDMRGSRLVRALYRVRGMPRAALTLEGLERLGFVLLGETPGREFVLGLVGRFWTPRGGIVQVEPEAFAAYAEPGRAKVAWNFRVEPSGGAGSTVLTETRIHCPDPPTLRRFRVYWTVVGPFSGLVRREMLRAVRRQAESGATAPES